MLKKVISSLLLGAAIAVITPISNIPFATSVAEAADVYACIYKGYEVYVQTETIGCGSENISAKVKYVKNGELVDIETWNFLYTGVWRSYTESHKRNCIQKGHGITTTRLSPEYPEYKILEVILNN